VAGAESMHLRGHCTHSDYVVGETMPKVIAQQQRKEMACLRL